MAPLPPLTPTPPESTGARIPARTRSEISDQALRQSNSSLIFVKLRKMIAADRQPTDAILGAIAAAAHSLTGATGAAVAMPRDGEVVCVGRSGESAPELGVRLNVDSGISGECLRTGVIMRCDDASRDFHVNAEVCRSLGLQSIAVVPLRGQHGRVGVLEAFSTESYAFTEDKMEVLGRLAGLAEAAWTRGAVTDIRPGEEGMPETEVAVVVEAPAEQPRPTVEEVPLAQVRAVFATARFTAQVKGAASRRKWLYPILAAAALLTMVLLSLYGWKAWYRASVASSTSQRAATPAAPTGDGENAGVAAGLASSPSVKHSSALPGGPSAPSAAKPAAGIADETIRRQPKSAPRSVRGSANGGADSRSVPNGEEIPQIAASSAEPADLREALAAGPALPTLGVPVSQGVAGGVLVRKVQPVYPPEARRMHVQGNVVIDATVTAQGQVDDVKLISGHPLLAPAALDAVRRWRYTPYTLNGNPIPKETRITISFIAPQ